MSSRVVMRKTAILLIGTTLLTTGCQQTVPLRLSAETEEPDRRPPQAHHRPGERKEAPYVNNDWLDDDGELEANLAGVGLALTASAIGTLLSPVAAASTHTFRWMSGDRAGPADRLLEDRASPDNRREGMNKLIDFGFLSNELFRKRCRQIAQSDTDFTVRAAAIRTGNRARDRRATNVFIKGLDDKSEWVRLESAKALANVPDVNAADGLVKLLSNKDETKDVRVAAADALKHYRTLPVARALTSALNEKAFVIAWQARRSLRYLTEKDFGYDEGAWLTYFTGPQTPLE